MTTEERATMLSLWTDLAFLVAWWKQWDYSPPQEVAAEKAADIARTLARANERCPDYWEALNENRPVQSDDIPGRRRKR